MFGEQLRMQPNDVTRLRIEADDTDAAGQRLQVCCRPGGGPEAVHHGKGIFLAVEIQRLETSPASRLKMVDPGVAGGFEGWQEIGCQHARAIDGLKAVAERGAHEVYFLCHSSLVYLTITDHSMPAQIAEPMTPATLGAMACISR